MMEGASRGEQSHILFGVVLDKEVDDVALPIDHICTSRSVSNEGLGWMGKRNTYDQRDCRKGRNP